MPVSRVISQYARVMQGLPLARQGECGDTLSHCICRRTDDHNVHQCTDASSVTPSGHCHGQWQWDGRAVTIVQYTTGAWTEDEAMEHLALLNAGKPLPPVGEAP